MHVEQAKHKMKQKHSHAVCASFVRIKTPQHPHSTMEDIGVLIGGVTSDCSFLQCR